MLKIEDGIKQKECVKDVSILFGSAWNSYDRRQNKKLYFFYGGLLF